MRYTFRCQGCGDCRVFDRSIAEGPPKAPDQPVSAERWDDEVYCKACDLYFTRDWEADKPHLNTAACRDHDHIPAEKRVVRSGSIRHRKDVNPVREEKRFQDHINRRRAQIREHGSNPEMRHTHSVPADLYHGKIRETGDKHYWDNPKNLARHSSTKVS